MYGGNEFTLIDYRDNPQGWGGGGGLIEELINKLNHRKSTSMSETCLVITCPNIYTPARSDRGERRHRTSRLTTDVMPSGQHVAASYNK